MDFLANKLRSFLESINPVLFNGSIEIPELKKLVVTTDTLIEGVHFPQQTPAHAVGYKSLAVNLSDIAAMGAMPLACSLVLGLPELKKQNQWLKEFVQGWAELAQQFKLPVCELNTFSTSEQIEVHVTAFGLLSEGEGLYRHTAQPGDYVYVSGAIGEAAAGLALEFHSNSSSNKDIKPRDNLDVNAMTNQEQRLVSRLRYPTPRVELGRALNEVASACLDISDGLIADLGHITQRSDVSARVNCDALYLSETLNEYCSKTENNRSALDYALIGGDDYELCFTIPPIHTSKITALSKKYDTRLTRIGKILEAVPTINDQVPASGSRSASNVKIIDEHGDSYFPQSKSYQHFD